MKINWVAYYMQNDGYGRFNSRLVQALQHLGVEVKAATMDNLTMPPWMQRQEGINWDDLTISCLPPYFLKDVPGRHWLFTMVEGSIVPENWVSTINSSMVERLIVPCQHNVDAFRNSGVVIPISIIPGGTDPDEFPALDRYTRVESINQQNPYTFLSLADRGNRKGWDETRDAFYLAFGGKTKGDKTVRLILKARPHDTVLNLMSKAEGRDERVVYQVVDSPSPYEVYKQAHCLVLPSRCEGWGMPHREAAMMGLPVITQRYSGLDDGFLEEWALVLEGGQMRPIPKEHQPSMGEWMVADKEDIAQKMRFCRFSPETADFFGSKARRWLSKNQTWHHSATALVKLIRGEPSAFQVERSTLRIHV